MIAMLFSGIFKEIDKREKAEAKLKQYEPYELVWATRYCKAYDNTDNTCVTVDDTAREGFYYPTEQDAIVGANRSMVNDSLEGYKVYFNTLEVYPTLKPK
jgi:hypothetical protein